MPSRASGDLSSALSSFPYPLHFLSILSYPCTYYCISFCASFERPINRERETSKRKLPLSKLSLASLNIVYGSLHRLPPSQWTRWPLFRLFYSFP